ncbi:MAG: hypothetical protein ACKV2T_37280 [Kofleriaceae bacterium]
MQRSPNGAQSGALGAIAASAVLVAAMTTSACQQPQKSAHTKTTPPAEKPFALAEVVGTWGWLLRTTSDGTTRIENEEWRFRPGATPTQLVGRYLRSVEVRSDDGEPFQCNQRPWYRQRAMFDVTVEPKPTVAGGYTIVETAYRVEPSPCDHDFRHQSTYTAELVGDQLRLAWEGGTQSLLHTDNGVPELAADPWASEPSLFGSWRWNATSYDDEGHVHDETEWWEVTRRSDTQIDGTYRRRVTVRSVDGSKLACANAPSWTFDDAYLFDGQREEEHWHFYERAVDPGDHPCLRTSPRRALDEATAEQRGESLVLEWRGKRRQVLFRPDGAL